MEQQSFLNKVLNEENFTNIRVGITKCTQVSYVLQMMTLGERLQITEVFLRVL